MPGDTSLIASSIFGRLSTRSSLISSRDYKATVQLLDDNETLDQDFKKSADGQQILDYVCKFLKIVEKDYFGLRYQDAYKHRYWIDMNKPISKQIRGPNVGLRFRVRFYPSDVTVLKEEITRYQLFVQLQRDLLHGRLHCPEKEAATLCALILQSVIGDYDAEPRSDDYVSEYRLILKQSAKLEEKIAEAHEQLKGLTPAEAELEFLKKASELDTYGFDPFSLTDKQGQPLYVGVTHRGIYIYHFGRKMHHIQWLVSYFFFVVLSQVEKVDYLGKSLFITPTTAYVPPCGTTTLDLNATTKKGSKSSSYGTLKLHCPSATFAKHLWRHILSQQAFFTESDAKHIKPKFSKPRIPLLSRGSTFRFPTARVLHEIELEGYAKRDGPEPTFTRYTLQRQPPRQQFIAPTSKYHTLPTIHLNNNFNATTTIPEEDDSADQAEMCSSPFNVTAPPVMQTNATTALNSSAIDNEECPVSEHVDIILTPPVKWLNHRSIKADKDVATTIKEGGVESTAKIQSEILEEFLMSDSSIKPLMTSTPIQSTVSTVDEQHDQQPTSSSSLQSNNDLRLQSATGTDANECHLLIQTKTRTSRGLIFSTLNVFFSFILLAFFLIALLIAIFESHPKLLNSSPTAEMLRHSYYEPFRSYLLSLYERFTSSSSSN
ncbi:unnamed protein product [Anisakis simplex]|uniref:Moesin/ezrin/radixin homolog 1 n=1 Tax=Anisakis simplex TaxID=6269 RepID=A0A0M3JZL1_ANISI|nr:unnamed protein product [Anisakis simplex]